MFDTTSTSLPAELQVHQFRKRFRTQIVKQPGPRFAIDEMAVANIEVETKIAAYKLQYRKEGCRL